MQLGDGELVARGLTAGLLLVLAAACGGDDGAAGACGDAVSLEIVSPMDGETITASEVEIAVHACNVFSTGSQIEVYETESLSTRYAVLDVASDDDVARTTVPLVPGSLTFEARTVDASVVSDPVSITVMLP